MSDDAKRSEMTYKPPPINPPTLRRLATAGLSAVVAVVAVFVLRAGNEWPAAALLIAGQVFALWTEVAIPYVGPPINPPVPPRRLLEAALEGIAVAALGLALFAIGQQPSALFTRAVAVAVAAQGIFLIAGVTAGRAAGRENVG
jgi:hypothetical protein